MPKFVVTTHEDEQAIRHEEDLNFPTEKAATDDAQNALVDMAREKLPNGSHANFRADVADADGNQIYRASLSFEGQSADDIREADAQASEAAQDVANALSGKLKT